MGSVWCPRCGTEYRDGFTVCADCSATLVGAPPPPRDGQQLVDAALELKRLTPEDRVTRARRLDLTENEQLALAAFAVDDPALAEVLNSNPTLTDAASAIAQLADRKRRPWWQKLLSP